MSLDFESNFILMDTIFTELKSKFKIKVLIENLFFSLENCTEFESKFFKVLYLRKNSSNINTTIKSYNKKVESNKII